ncbi:transposase [Enterococcus casseliflavus]|uniref:transposase n=1 Tax=Enterococcus casseliflavus TaxID=37734 RepID=UPI0017833F6B|nr:transposase [Enterococcus casseliflavus]QOG30504.1 transposase [Enterococcus casseliflavus]
MSTLQHKQLTFNKNITLANDGGKISSDSGLGLIKEFMNRIGFSSILEEQVKLTDSRRNPDHTYNDIIEQLLLQLIAGYSKDVAANRLRLDPIFKTFFSNKSILASQPTISRFFKAITKETIPQFMQVAQQLADMQITQNNIQDMVIDLDSTHSDTYGNQERADFNRHSQTTNYHPHGAQLRPGNVYTSRNAETFLTKIVTHFSKHPCNMNLMVRGNSGFAKPEIYNFCNEKDIRFVIRLNANSRLRSEADQYVI